MDAERARATLAASLGNSWDRGAADVDDKLATCLRESAWHPDVPNHHVSAFVARWDRNAVASSDSDMKRFARVAIGVQQGVAKERGRGVARASEADGETAETTRLDCLLHAHRSMSAVQAVAHRPSTRTAVAVTRSCQKVRSNGRAAFGPRPVR